MHDSLAYCIALNKTRAISYKLLQKLRRHYSNLEDIFTAKQSSLREIGLTQIQASAISEFNFKHIEKDLAWIKESGHAIIPIDTEDYPLLLSEIANPPLLLYVEGNVDNLHLPQIAIVGSRKPTPAGQENAYRFAKYLASGGFIITSGLALGIDTAGHQGALATNQTIAVLGTGIDVTYPYHNKELRKKILAKGGTIISEFPLCTRPEKTNFPQRNRIISGLSLGTLIIEAAIKSGSLITAKYAMEQGREIFAVPGSIHNTQAKGCHHLIREGAKLTENVNDILQELSGLLDLMKTSNPRYGQIKLKSSALCSFLPKNKQEKLDFANLDEDHSSLLASVTDEAISIESLVNITGFTAKAVSAMLLTLELNGLVKRVLNGYSRKR